MAKKRNKLIENKIDKKLNQIDVILEESVDKVFKDWFVPVENECNFKIVKNESLSFFSYSEFSFSNK